MYAPVSMPAFLPAGPGLSLRPWRARDARELIDAYRDPLLRQFTRTWPEDEAGARAWLAREEAGARDGSRYSFAVELAAQAPDGTGPAPSGVRDPAATGLLAGFASSSRSSRTTTTARPAPTPPRSATGRPPRYAAGAWRAAPSWPSPTGRSPPCPR